MRYMGGKSKYAKEIAQVITYYRMKDSREVFFDPMCGGLSVPYKLRAPMILNDYHSGLVKLYKQLQKGTFKFPDTLSQEDYNNYRSRKSTKTAIQAFVGFGLSFAGKWYGGYDSWEDRHGNPGGVQRASMNSLKRKFASHGISTAEFHNKSYDEFTPKDQIIYIDPPYENTTEYDGVDAFDHVKFWNVVREWSKENTVLVSEYSAPDDFECVWQKKGKTQMAVNQIDVTEMIFKLK